MAIEQLQLQPHLIDQVHDRLLAAIVDGTLAPGERLTQEGLASMLGVSRQPVSHAIQILKRRGLLVEAGKRGVSVPPVDAKRIVDLYRLREALDGMAAELAAGRVHARSGNSQALGALNAALAAGQRLDDHAATAELIDADVAFHVAVHQLSGNSAIAETVAEVWPHFRRSMGVVLAAPGMRKRVWSEHEGIARAILAGDARVAGRLARIHTARAGEETARRLQASVSAA